MKSILQARIKVHKHTVINILNCIVCDNQFSVIKKRKTCSLQCLKTIQRKKRIKYLKDNAGTFNWIHKGKFNQFEQYFNDWLSNIGYIKDIDYYALTHIIENNEKETFYILDFYFPKLNLNIELDGTHHEKDEQRIRDTVRDEFLARIKNITVLRIKGRDWNSKHKREIIKSNLLNGVLDRSRTCMYPITVSTS
jgi:hypothetical protein